MYKSVTWDKSKGKQKPPAEERAEGKGIDWKTKNKKGGYMSNLWVNYTARTGIRVEKVKTLWGQIKTPNLAATSRGKKSLITAIQFN